MLKYLSIFATLVALTASSANAQQREAIFQKISVPGDDFDIVLAEAKPGSPTLYYRNQPDPNVIYLGNDLVTAYTTELSEMLDVATLLHPAYSFAPGSADNNARTPVLIYLIPKRAAPNAAIR